MAMTPAQIQKRSDDKRGVKTKGLKMKLEDIALLERLAAETGLPQAELVARALREFAAKRS